MNCLICSKSADTDVLGIKICGSCKPSVYNQILKMSICKGCFEITSNGDYCNYCQQRQIQDRKVLMCDCCSDWIDKYDLIEVELENQNWKNVCKDCYENRRCKECGKMYDIYAGMNFDSDSRLCLYCEHGGWL